MRTLVSRLRRQLTYANVMASIAVFLALGGVGYAASSINGKQIVKHTIGAGKLKKKTLGSNQVKADGLTGAVIDESTLSLVPQAQSAVTASSAATAQTADTANTATSAQTAKTATTAAVAEEAETLEGMSPEELVLSCPEATELFGAVTITEIVVLLGPNSTGSLSSPEATVTPFTVTVAPSSSTVGVTVTLVVPSGRTAT